MSPNDDIDEAEDGVFKCWCGAEGEFDDMCDAEVFSQTCGGTGTLHCECGGDNLCVCHHHGEIECPGCEDCDGDDFDDFYDDDEDYD